MAIALFVVVAGAFVYGYSYWKVGTKKLHGKLEKFRLPISPTTYDVREIESLPLPVQRYFRAVLNDDQPIVSAARITQIGQFNRGEKKAKWNPFSASQVVITHRPGFDWDARITISPGLHVFVHDAYVAGNGVLHAELLGLVTLADLGETPEIAQGELMRFLVEAAWYPTALLPSQGVLWEAIDDMSARATLTDGVTTVSLNFFFDSDGYISEVRAPARYRIVSGTLDAKPWQCRFWRYEIRDGMRIPLEGEVAWELTEGSWPYWRARITDISYDFARYPNS